MYNRYGRACTADGSKIIGGVGPDNNLHNTIFHTPNAAAKQNWLLWSSFGRVRAGTRATDQRSSTAGLVQITIYILLHILHNDQPNWSSRVPRYSVYCIMCTGRLQGVRRSLSNGARAPRMTQDQRSGDAVRGGAPVY